MSEITEVPGYGTKGIWQGHEVALGRASWLGALAVARTAAWLTVGDAPAQAFEFTDRLRDGAAAAVTGLLQAGKEVYLMSGDTTAAVEEMARPAGHRRIGWPRRCRQTRLRGCRPWPRLANGC